MLFNCFLRSIEIKLDGRDSMSSVRLAPTPCVTRLLTKPHFIPYDDYYHRSVWFCLILLIFLILFLAQQCLKKRLTDGGNFNLSIARLSNGLVQGQWWSLGMKSSCAGQLWLIYLINLLRSRRTHDFNSGRTMDAVDLI